MQRGISNYEFRINNPSSLEAQLAGDPSLSCRTQAAFSFKRARAEHTSRLGPLHESPIPNH